MTLYRVLTASLPCLNRFFTVTLPSLDVSQPCVCFHYHNIVMLPIRGRFQFIYLQVTYKTDHFIQLNKVFQAETARWKPENRCNKFLWRCWKCHSEKDSYRSLTLTNRHRLLISPPQRIGDLTTISVSHISREVSHAVRNLPLLHSVCNVLKTALPHVGAC